MTETLVRAPHSPMLVWGYNNSGGLGLGHVARVYRPAQSALPAGVTAVQGGGEFTVARTSAGELYACGGNRYGELGDGGTQTRLTWEPVRLLAGTFVADVQAGIDHVLALTARGEVYAWGRNHRGQVGSGPTEHQLTPARVIESGAASLAAGRGTSAAVTTDGQLLTWGRSGSGQTGLGATSDATTPTASLLTGGVKAAAVDVGYQHTVVLTTTGELLAFGVGPLGRPLPLRVPLDQDWGQVRAIRAGSSFTLALTSPEAAPQVRERLDAALPDGIDVVDVTEAGLDGSPEASVWQVALPGVQADVAARAVAGFLALTEAPVERLTDKGVRRMDARSAVREMVVLDPSDELAAADDAQAFRRVAVTNKDGCAILRMVVLHMAPAVRPEDVLSALSAEQGLVPSSPPLTIRLAQLWPGQGRPEAEEGWPEACQPEQGSRGLLTGKTAS